MSTILYEYYYYYSYFTITPIMATKSLIKFIIYK